MKNCILTILCEGQTEANFATKILKPYFYAYNIYVKTVILQTSRKKGVSGGMVSYMKVLNDLGRIFASIHPNISETNIVTTMFDFYALPTDFIGYEDAMKQNGPYAQVTYIEHSFETKISRRNFIPYIQLHEFEALLFSDIIKLQIDYPNATKEIEKLKIQTDNIGNPEMINHGLETAPSKRIINCLHPKYRYNKVKSGESVASAITLPIILSRCAHFRDWISRIMRLSNQLEDEK